MTTIPNMRSLIAIVESAATDPEKLARLKAAGFDTDHVLYHGSNADFAVFDMKRLRTAAHFYTSPDPDTARGYGDIIYVCVGRQDPQANLVDDWTLISQLAATFADQYHDAVETDEDLAAVKQHLVQSLLQQHAGDDAYDEWDAEQDAEASEAYIAARDRAAKDYVVNLITSGEAYGITGSFQNHLMDECFANGYKSVRFTDPSSTGESVSVVFNDAADVVILGKLT